MDFEFVENIENGIIIKNVRNFELPHIFDCGQCFRWTKKENGNYIGVAFKKVIEIEKRNNDVILYNTNQKEFDEIWANYFDLYRDYDSIKDVLSKDLIVKKSIEFGNGMRILKQDPLEIVISFIISANNRIPMIKREINNISKMFGEKMVYKNEEYYSFPTIERLNDATIEQLEECGVGYRAPYIKDTVNKIYNGDMDLNYIKSLNDDDCYKELQKFSGVGPKVSDCIMLFSMQKYSAFPVDVWVKRAMIHFYLAPNVSLKKIRDFGRDKFEELSGFAQQYLFYYVRENNITI